MGTPLTLRSLLGSISSWSPFQNTKTHWHKHSHSIWKRKERDLSDQLIRKLFPFWIPSVILHVRFYYDYYWRSSSSDFFNDRYVLLAFIIASTTIIIIYFQTSAKISSVQSSHIILGALTTAVLRSRLLYDIMMANNSLLNDSNWIACLQTA